MILNRSRVTDPYLHLEFRRGLGSLREGVVTYGRDH
jgi:hypothetical protein